MVLFLGKGFSKWSKTKNRLELHVHVTLVLCVTVTAIAKKSLAVADPGFLFTDKN